MFFYRGFENARGIYKVHRGFQYKLKVWFMLFLISVVV